MDVSSGSSCVGSPQRVGVIGCGCCSQSLICKRGKGASAAICDSDSRSLGLPVGFPTGRTKQDPAMSLHPRLFLSLTSSQWPFRFYRGETVGFMTHRGPLSWDFSSTATNHSLHHPPPPPLPPHPRVQLESPISSLPSRLPGHSRAGLLAHRWHPG